MALTMALLIKYVARSVWFSASVHFPWRLILFHNIIIISSGIYRGDAGNPEQLSLRLLSCFLHLFSTHPNYLVAVVWKSGVTWQRWLTIPLWAIQRLPVGLKGSWWRLWCLCAGHGHRRQVLCLFRQEPGGTSFRKSDWVGRQIRVPSK